MIKFTAKKKKKKVTNFLFQFICPSYLRDLYGSVEKKNVCSKIYLQFLSTAVVVVTIRLSEVIYEHLAEERKEKRENAGNKRIRRWIFVTKYTNTCQIINDNLQQCFVRCTEFIMALSKFARCSILVFLIYFIQDDYTCNRTLAGGFSIRNAFVSRIVESSKRYYLHYSKKKRTIIVLKINIPYLFTVEYRTQKHYKLSSVKLIFFPTK